MDLVAELKKEIDSLKAQQRNALEVYQQATAALSLAEYLLPKAKPTV